jgi:hypothetical protein
MQMNEQGGISAWIQQHMTLVLLLIGGLVVGVLFLKKTTPGASSTAQSAQADLSGLATDANGRPIVYRDVADTFINISKNSTTTTTNSNNTMPVPSAPSAPPSSPAGPIEHPIEAIVRSRFNSPLTAHYDTGQPRGVPLRSSPGGAITGYAPYGSQVELKSGSETSGVSNLDKTTGSTEWFVTSNGAYISAYDLTGGYQ